MIDAQVHLFDYNGTVVDDFGRKAEIVTTFVNMVFPGLDTNSHPALFTAELLNGSRHFSVEKFVKRIFEVLGVYKSEKIDFARYANLLTEISFSIRVRVVEGSREYIEALKNRDRVVALVTNSSIQVLRRWLVYAGLDDLFPEGSRFTSDAECEGKKGCSSLVREYITMH